jgi:hypothetical protein
MDYSCMPQPEVAGKAADKQQPKATSNAAAKPRSSDAGAAKKPVAPASKQQKQQPGSSEKQQQDKKPPQKAAAAAAKKPAGKAAAAVANGAADVKKEQALRVKKEFDLPGQTRETPDEVGGGASLRHTGMLLPACVAMQCGSGDLHLATAALAYSELEVCATIYQLHAVVYASWSFSLAAAAVMRHCPACC